MADALEACKAVLRDDAGNVVALNNAAALLHLAGRPEEARPYIRRAVALVPDVPEVLFTLGDGLRLGRAPEAAARAYLRALRLRPLFPEALNNLGLALRALGRRADAAGCFLRAVQARPDYAEAINNFGNAVHGQLQVGDAVLAYRLALALAPGMAAAWANFGNAHLSLCAPAAAGTSYRRSLAIAADPAVHDNLIFSMLSDPAVTPAAERGEARRWAARHARPAAPADSFGKDDPERPLTVGYLSADLRRHPVAGNLIEVVQRHDRARFRVHFYAEVATPDATTERFRALADGWLSTSGLADAEVAAAIRRDRVDILVVVAAHTAANRPAIAAHRPAPLAVSLYAPCTTGLEQVDHWLSDPVLTPPEFDPFFVEQVHRLPVLYTFQTPAAPEPRPRAAGAPLAFGSFNNPGKLHDGVFAAWTRILTRLPEARLRLGYQRFFDDPAVRRRVLDALGAAAGRIAFLPEAADAAAHLARLGEVDIVLDSFPFAGANSTFEPLWMGTPVITLAGDRFIARCGAGLMGPLGLGDLIATDDADYVERAVRLAGDEARRASLRTTLRESLRRSPLMDYPAQTRALEDAYRAMWRRHCASVGD